MILTINWPMAADAAQNTGAGRGLTGPRVLWKATGSKVSKNILSEIQVTHL